MIFFSDPDISICFNAATKDPSEKTCCSKSSELSYVTAAENFLRDTIRIKNAYLKKLVMDHIVQYEGKVGSIVGALVQILPLQQGVRVGLRNMLIKCRVIPLCTYVYLCKKLQMLCR